MALHYYIKLFIIPTKVSNFIMSLLLSCYKHIYAYITVNTQVKAKKKIERNVIISNTCFYLFRNNTKYILSQGCEPCMLLWIEFSFFSKMIIVKKWFCFQVKCFNISFSVFNDIKQTVFPNMQPVFFPTGKIFKITF